MTEPTGWPPSALMQDDCKALSKWLAKRACCICWKRKVKGQTMTEPTDAEIDEIYRSTFLAMPNVARQPPQTVPPMVRDFARAVLAKWGTPPAGVGEPDFYTACAWYEGGGEGGWIALPGYSNETEHGVKHLVLEAARKEGYKGTAAGRLLELGWEIRPVFLTPQPTQAQAGAVPLTHDEALDAFCHTPGIHQFVQAFMAGVRFAEQHHGIKGGQHGPS